MDTAAEAEERCRSLPHRDEMPQCWGRPSENAEDVALSSWPGRCQQPRGVETSIFDFRLVELAWDNANNRTGSSNHEKPHNSNAGQVRSDPVSASGAVVISRLQFTTGAGHRRGRARLVVLKEWFMVGLRFSIFDFRSSGIKRK